MSVKTIRRSSVSSDDLLYGGAVQEIADGFWNIRGSFKVLGFVDLGTQASLVKLKSGKFVLLDCVPLEGGARSQVMRLTEDGKSLEAIINLHPFHTLHCKKVVELFPDATLYGTARHHTKRSNLDWAPEKTETAAFAERYAEDFDFMVPRGVDFIPDNENLHFSSVLAFHRASKTLHVDDTVNYVALPLVKKLNFHPSLGGVLQRRKEAAQEFRDWAGELIERCKTVQHICTAHMRRPDPGQFSPIAEELRQALRRAEKKLARHEQSF